MIDTRPKPKPISITTAPLSMPKEEAFECATRDRGLIDHICKFADKLREQNVEVFERRENIIATERGYFFAYYDEDIRNMEGGIDNPIPYKGKDGRMKVMVKAETGQWSEQDLAYLIALAYVGNLKKYKHTWFRDGDINNLIADNIYWLPTWKYRLKKFIHDLKLKK